MMHYYALRFQGRTSWVYRFDSATERAEWLETEAREGRTSIVLHATHRRVQEACRMWREGLCWPMVVQSGRK